MSGARTIILNDDASSRSCQEGSPCGTRDCAPAVRRTKLTDYAEKPHDKTYCQIEASRHRLAVFYKNDRTYTASVSVRFQGNAFPRRCETAPSTMGLTGFSSA